MNCLGVNAEKLKSIVLVLNRLAHHTIGKMVTREKCESTTVALWGNMRVDRIDNTSPYMWLLCKYFYRLSFGEKELN